MNDKAQNITKEKPDLDAQIMKIRTFNNIAAFQRLTAKLFELEMNDYRGKNELHPDIAKVLEYLVEGIEAVQVTINDSLHNACIHVFKTQEEREKEEQEEQVEYREWQMEQAELRSDYYHAIRI